MNKAITWLWMTAVIVAATIQFKTPVLIPFAIASGIMAIAKLED
jgi:hypothetical protein